MRAAPAVKPLGSVVSRLKAFGKDFSRDERGFTAVEFAMVAMPFLMLLFGTIAVGLYFFTTFTLENAVEKAAHRILRQWLTGERDQAIAGLFNAARDRDEAIAVAALVSAWADGDDSLTDAIVARARGVQA